MRGKLLALVLLGVLLVMPTQVAFAQDTGGDKLVLGGNYVLRANEDLNGSLAVVGGNATLEPNSLLKGDVVVLGGALTIGGTVRGSVAVFGGAVTLADGAVVTGDLASFGGALERAPGAVITGEVFDAFRSSRGGGDVIPTPQAPQLPTAPSASGVPSVSDATREPLRALGQLLGWEVRTAAWALLLVLLGLAAVVLAPKAVSRIASQVAGEPILSFGVGLLTLIVAALAGVLLLIACGLGLLIWLTTAFALLVGWIAVGLWVGQRLLRGLKARQPSSLGAVALGVALITVGARLPWCLGFPIAVILGSIGLGAVVLTRFGTQPSGGTGRASLSPGGTGEAVAQPPVLLPPAGGAQVDVQPSSPVDLSLQAEQAEPSAAPAELLDAPIIGEAPAEVEPAPPVILDEPTHSV